MLASSGSADLVIAGCFAFLLPPPPPPPLLFFAGMRMRCAVVVVVAQSTTDRRPRRRGAQVCFLFRFASLQYSSIMSFVSFRAPNYSYT